MTRQPIGLLTTVLLLAAWPLGSFRLRRPWAVDPGEECRHDLDRRNRVDLSTAGDRACRPGGSQRPGPGYGRARRPRPAPGPPRRPGGPLAARLPQGIAAARHCGPGGGRREGAAEPHRIRPPRAPPRRSRRLGNNGQRTGHHFHQTTFRRRGLPPRGVPRRRTRHPGADQDSRRCQPLSPQARPGGGVAGCAARQRCPTAHRPLGRRPGRPCAGQYPQVLRGSSPVAGGADRTGNAGRSDGPVPACLRAQRAVGPGGRGAGIGKDDADELSGRRARPESSGRCRRGGIRDRHSASERGAHADPPGPTRSKGGRPAPAGGGVSADGAGRRHCRRGQGSRGDAAHVDLVVGSSGVHHHSRRLGPPGPVATAVYLPAGGDRFGAQRDRVVGAGE